MTQLISIYCQTNSHTTTNGATSLSTSTGNAPRQGWRTPLNNIIYSEQRDEETGYGYFGARYMDHKLMTMWLSVDPMADKYPDLSPYNYCAWNPVKLVDPDGLEALENDDWYKNRKGEMRWFNSSAETYTHEGEEYTRHGKTAYMTNSDGEFVYGDQYGHTHQSAPLKEVSITENRTDFERTMQNPIVQDIHKSAADFWGHPVTEAVLDVVLFVTTGGVEAVAEGISKSIIKHKARTFFKNTQYSKRIASQASKKDFHAIPQSVDAYAARYGDFSTTVGCDGHTYKWLTMKGGYGGKTGTFEYIKNEKNVINHRFFRPNK